MQRAAFILYPFFAALAGGLVSPARAGDTGALPHAQTRPASGRVFTDLDGDRQTDVASTGASRHEGTGWVQDVTLRFSAAAATRVTVRTSFRADRLTVRDLDGDADRDLVVEGFNREPAAVLLNDGDGHFHQGDLDDFRFQLSHRSPRSLASGAWDSPLPESGECPNDEPAAVAPFGIRPQLADARLMACVQECGAVWLHFGAPSRGPPSHC